MSAEDIAAAERRKGASGCFLSPANVCADLLSSAARSFKKFTYRGVELDQLLDLSTEQLMDVVHARARRRFQRGLKRKPMALIKKLRTAKKEAAFGEKPAVVKTHLRDMIIVPEMIGSVIGIYNGKVFNAVEIKPEMVGYYLAEFSISYKPVRHGRPGIGATHSSRFVRRCSLSLDGASADALLVCADPSQVRGPTCSCAFSWVQSHVLP